MRQDKALLQEMVLRNYVHAKDENRPHFLDATFEADAQLEVRNSTMAIAFPAITTGRAAPRLASRLVISICSMQVLPAEAAPEILAWVTSLSYPWSSPAEALMGAPGLPELQPVLQQLRAT